MSKHEKHTALNRKNNDSYASNEIAILGVKCSIISDLCQKIAQNHQKIAKIAYLDASHSDAIETPFLETYTFHHSGNVLTEKQTVLNPYNTRILFSQYDLVLINGNHYQASNQILILDNEKEASVKKRLSQLINIKFVIKATKDASYFDCVLEAFPKIKEIPCYDLEDVDAISKQITAIIQDHTPKICGLVLAGGESKRMQKDKTMIQYFKKPQLEHVQQMLEKQGIETFVSVKRATKKHQIADSFTDLGPFGGICSAFRFNPNVAWLVLATDLPFVDEALIKMLISQRDPSKIATAIKGVGKKFMEPLITLYEPKAYPVFLQYLSQGYACPRKVLINSEVKIIEVADALIRNVNTPEEYTAAQKEING